MVPFLFYAACAVASVGLLLLLKPRSGVTRSGAALAGLAGLAWMLALAAETFDAARGDLLPLGGFVLCALISVASAVRVITHPRPVFCALYFILVVVSGAAMYVLLSAEFVAFALVIVYAGAILITYLFVLMLAQQSPDENHGAEAVGYDRIAREPASAVFAGFVIVAVLGAAIFSPRSTTKSEATQTASIREAWSDLGAMPGLLLARAKGIDPLVASVQGPDGRPIMVILPDHSARIAVTHTDGSPTLVTLPPSALPDNPSRVGMALVTRFPVSLELAGVILLMAMLGAVVLARRQTELADEQRRVHAGRGRASEPTPGGAP
ncbi:MAG: hypothetical protein EXS03_00335 [Phycisphaerales bacterium]|nr:hypothetical protein [Phycisphaerales bacterium]